MCVRIFEFVIVVISLLAHCQIVVSSDTLDDPRLPATRVSGGFTVDLQTRHGFFRERGMLQKRSGSLAIEGAVREMG